ncbi:MAG: polyamine aminopropyltransferase [Hyphomicrobiales bacterium]
MERWIDETLHPHWRVSLKAERVLHEVRTEHQHLVIFDNPTFGRMMMLDGVVQLSTTDEFIYHEMMAHVPLLAHREPRRVLIIGGGDGGVLREVLKHASVEKAVLCEIDRQVIDTSLQYLPEISAGAFDDPRTEILIADGVKFVAETDQRFDCIIVDSTEPIGPAEVLFGRPFFEGCKRALNKGGVVIGQNGLPFVHAGHLAGTGKLLGDIFRDSACFLCGQPTYFGGPFALTWASDKKDMRDWSAKKLARRQKKRNIVTRYYTADVHVGAFDLPVYIQDIWAGGPGLVKA